MKFFKKDSSDAVLFLNPRYFNVLSKLLIIAGIGLLSTPLWREILNEVFLRIGIKLFSEYDPIYGLIVIIITLLYNYCSQKLILDKVDHEKSKPRNEKFRCKLFDNYLELCQALIPILDDNKYILKTFGPNSNAEELGILRTDLTLWYDSRSEIIVPNNTVLNCNIEKNMQLIPSENLDIFKALQSHIYAFEKHVINPNFDYTLYQFPSQIEIVIKNHCFSNNTADKYFEEVIKWLKYQLFIKDILEISMVGSFLFSTHNSGDLDLVLKLNTNNQQRLFDIKRKLNKVEHVCKLKFMKSLHFTVFTLDEFSEYEKFIEANKFILKFHGQRHTLFHFGLFS